jgi:hypothetical protein
MTLPWGSNRFDQAAAHVVGGGGGGGGSGSGWGDHGTWLASPTTTVVTNDTITGSDTSGLAQVRGTQGHAIGTGKWYFEIKLLTAPGSNILDIGLLDATVAAGTGLNNTDIGFGCANSCNDGHARSGAEPGGVNIGSAITLANNDILGVAFDSDNGFHYLSQNGTYFLSGNPASGGSGTGHVGGYNLPSLRTYYPNIAIWALVNAVAQLITTDAAFAHKPTGYLAWG